jgi:hypothetical protein
MVAPIPRIFGTKREFLLEQKGIKKVQVLMKFGELPGLMGARPEATVHQWVQLLKFLN